MKDDDRIALLAGAGLSADENPPMSVELAANLRSALTGMAQNPGGTTEAVIKRETARMAVSIQLLTNGGVHFQERCHRARSRCSGEHRADRHRC